MAARVMPVAPSASANASPSPEPTPEKVEDPPPVPMSQLLIDHIKSLWMASASAVQIQQQVKNQPDLSSQNLNATPGVLASEVLTYSPSKINKTDSI